MDQSAGNQAEHPQPQREVDSQSQVLGALNDPQILDAEMLLVRQLLQGMKEVRLLERVAISQELHDTISRNLTAISLDLKVVQEYLELEPAPLVEVRRLLATTAKLVEGLAQNVRNIMEDLRTGQSLDSDLSAALTRYGQLLAKRVPIEMVVIVADGFPDLPVEVETVFFRIAQESLINVLLHSDAERVTISLLPLSVDGVRMVIEDDGAGFDVVRIQQRTAGHYGLRIMQERAESIGATFEIDSAPEQGTRVIVEVFQ